MTDRKRVFVWLLAGCAMTGCAPPGSALPPRLPPPEPGAAVEVGDGGDEAVESEPLLFGRFRHAGGEADIAGRDAAVDAVAQELPMFVREKARGRLGRIATIHDEITITKSDDTVSIDFGGEAVPAAPLGGDPVDFEPPDGGETVKVSFRMDGARLVQTLQGARGGTRRIYTPRAAGKLMVHVTIYGERLPKTVEYDLNYALQKTPPSP